VPRAASLALLLALAGCASRPALPPPAPEPDIALAAGVLTFRGHITQRSYAALLAAADAGPVHTLRIRSGGGEVGNAIEIARWVHRNGVDVVVDGVCFSSCSNYIFQAGREKHIVSGGIVGWHGTIEHLLYLQTSGARPPEAQLQAVRAMAERERAFYAEVGINGYIAWFGKIAPYHVPNLYFLSGDDMRYFGLTGLHVRDDYLSSDLAPFNREEKDTLRLLTVDRAVTNPADPNWGAPRAAK
jgi:hypothetical protein